MKVLIAIDSLKGSLTSMDAGTAIAEGIRLADPDAEVQISPLADGGEGTVDALTSGMGGKLQNVIVKGPLGESVKCTYGILEKNRTAIIEMAGAAGIILVPTEKRNPMYTSTFGVGEVICDAIQKGCRRFIIGIGGSATNDGGAGMLQALGYGLLNKAGQQIPRGAVGLKDLSTITTEHVIPELEECEFLIACDVKNPLCGEFGASAVFGPQKGATTKMVEEMDLWLSEYADIAKKIRPNADAKMPGTGASGGLGFAFQAFLQSELKSGIHIVLEETSLEEKIKEIDYVITGEGRLDLQTAMGKAPIGVAELAKKHHKTVIAFAGSVTQDATECNVHGIDAFFPIIRRSCTLENAMDPEQARCNMKDTAEQVFRLIRAVSERKS